MTTNRSELISIIIPCRNGANYLAEAVAGIRKQDMPVEIIVVDDNSADQTAVLAESLDCRVIRHMTTRGQVAGKNTGLKESRGKYIVFHDHDDVMNEGVLAKMHQELVSDNSLYLVMAKVQDFFSPELDEKSRQLIQIKAEPYYGLFTGAVLMRWKLFDIMGYFDERLNTGEIIALMAKIEAEPALRHKRIDLVASNRRVHNANFGRTHAGKERQDYLNVLRAKLRP